MRIKANSNYLTNISLQNKISTEQLCDFSLTMYLCFSAFVFAINYFLKPFGLGGLARGIALIIIYLPIVFNAILKKRIVTDFWLIWIGVAFFFLVSYILHPEYELWYTRPEYGVWEYVLRPDNGIYIYLLLRLVNDPKRIIRCIKLSSWPMYFYYILQIERALARGYWIDTSNRGYEIHLSYNLSLGYNVLIFVLVFLYCFFEEKKIIDCVGGAVGIGIIIVAGSRGPFLDLLIFCIIYALIKINDNKKRIIITIRLFIIGMVLYFTYPFLLANISEILDRLNLSSRFIEKLLNGSIADDSGRMPIWKAAIDMIKECPFGHGAMGSRHELYQFIYVAHPHQFFLEILIDFGVIFGTIIILWLLYWTLKLFLLKNNDAWKGVFLIFFSRACQLLLSLTFWHSIGLWSTLAVGVCMWQEKKRRINHGE